MSVDPTLKTEPGPSIPVARPATAQGITGRTGADAVPVARPAPPRPKLATEEAPERMLTPEAIRGWATSIVLHLLFLLIFGLWYIAPKVSRSRVFDTRLAGSPFGDESGTELTGGLGMDTPLAMPELPSGPSLTSTTITSVPLSELKLDPGLAGITTPGASNGGGVNLSNPGSAGSGDGFGVARFGSGGETINDVDVKVGDPQFTLIWDSRADIDIHVLEPGGSHIFWETRNGTQGGELDVDDVDGFGPENVYWVQGKGPPGRYKWYVHYYGGLGGIAMPTRWKVRLKHDGKITLFQGRLNFIGDKSRVYEFALEKGLPPPETPRVGDAAK